MRGEMLIVQKEIISMVSHLRCTLMSGIAYVNALYSFERKSKEGEGDPNVNPLSSVRALFVCSQA